MLRTDKVDKIFDLLDMYDLHAVCLLSRTPQVEVEIRFVPGPHHQAKKRIRPTQGLQIKPRGYPPRPPPTLQPQPYYCYSTEYIPAETIRLIDNANCHSGK